MVELACMISEQSPVKPEDAYDIVYLFLGKKMTLSRIQIVLVEEHHSSCCQKQ